MNTVDFLSGMLAGWSQVLVGQPLDLLKVRIQTEKKTSTKMTQIIKEIYSAYGLKGFYRGSSSLFLGFSGTVAVEFVIYEWAKRQLYYLRQNRSGLYDPGKLKLWEAGLAGGFAGWILAFIYCPIQYAKIQRQVSTTSNESAVGLLLRQCYKKGVRSVYRGFLLTTVRQMFGTSLYYLTYEGMVRACTGNRREEAEGKVFLMAGATAGVCYHLLTYPVDTLKSNVQAGLTWKQSVSNSMSMSKLAGYKVALVWAVLVNACNFYVYEKAQKWLISNRNANSLY